MEAKTQSLAKRSSDSSLMPPPPAPKRQKRPPSVLDEDVYSNALSHIIARDFFPGLVESQAQQEYLEALNSADKDWIRESGRRLTDIMTPRSQQRGRRGTSFASIRSAVGDSRETLSTSSGFTPSRAPSAKINPDHFAAASDCPNLDMSLGAFQAKYTSEDNESFNRVLDRQNEKHASKVGFFHQGNHIRSRREIMWHARQQDRIANGASGTHTSLVVQNAAGEHRTAVASGGPSEDLDARPASIELFKDRQGPKNSFMFCPEGVEDEMPSHAQLAEQKSNAPPKSIQYAATRFPTAQASSEAQRPPSPSISAIDAAVSGCPRPTQSETGYDGADTPRVNGYAFVDAEPTPSEMGEPVPDEEADAVEQEAVLRLLPQPDEGGLNPFAVKDRSKREDVLHRLVEKADVSRRRDKGNSGERIQANSNRVERLRGLGITPSTGRTPTPRFASAPKGAYHRPEMTPAARRLAETLHTPRRKDGDLFDPGRKPCEEKTRTPTPMINRKT